MGYYPRTDMFTNTVGMILEIAIPGLSVSDIKLEFSDGKLILSGRNKERDQHAVYSYKELSTGFFSRTYIINTRVFDTSKITSKVINGLLTINIPYKDKNNSNKVNVINIIGEENNGN
jgi:HSP20 family molecular chaperone IbpA